MARPSVALLLFVCAACSVAPAPQQQTSASAAPVIEPPKEVVAPPTPPPPAGPMRVLVGGDLLPHRPSLTAPGAVKDALAPLAALFGKADAVVANYESATGDLDPHQFRLAYAATPAWLGALKPAGITAITIANNHTCDLGEPGLYATIDAAEKYELPAIGGDAKDPWAPKVLVERSGKKVCAVAWTTIVNAEGPCMKSNRLAFAPTTSAGKAKVDRAMRVARSRCDATIAILHGGEEYRPQTSQVMDQAGHAAEAGADAVIIHHPHIASPVVIHTTKDGRDVPIFASVGNLVTNQGESWKPPMFPVLRENRRLVCINGWTRLGVIADLGFRFDTTPPRLDWGLHLTWTDNEHTENKNAPIPKIATRVLDPTGDKAIVSQLEEDPVGPVDLFEDKCWIERPDASDDPRCHASIVHGVPIPALAGTSSRVRKRRH